jgi:hypothetical protein
MATGPGILSPPRPRHRPAAPHVSGPGALLAVAGVVGALLLGVLGWIVGAAIEPAPVRPAPLPAPQTARIGAFRVVLPSEWAPRAAPPGSAAAAAGARAFSPLLGSPTVAWVARGRADDRSLVPAAVRAVLAGRLERPQRVELAGRPAWSYVALRRRDGGRLDLVVAPTRHGVLLSGCESSPGGLALGGCGGGVLDLTGPRPLVPAHGLALRLRAAPALRALRHERATIARRLAHARTRAARAALERRMARAHAAAAAAIAPVAGHAGQRVVTTLRRVQVTLVHLARATRHGAPGHYRTVRWQVRMAERRLRRSVASLAAATAPGAR